MTDIEIPISNLGLSITASSTTSFLGDCNNDRRMQMVAETGNTYITKTMTYRTEIPMASLEFMSTRVWRKCSKWLWQRTTTRNSKQVAKTRNIYISQTMQRASKFWPWRAQKRVGKWLWQCQTKENGSIAIFGPLTPFPVVGWFRNLLGILYFDAVHHCSRNISISSLAATLLFPVLHQCCIYLGTLFMSTAWRGRKHCFCH